MVSITYEYVISYLVVRDPGAASRSAGRSASFVALLRARSGSNLKPIMWAVPSSWTTTGPSKFLGLDLKERNTWLGPYVSCTYKDFLFFYLSFHDFPKYMSHCKFCKSIPPPLYDMAFGSNRRITLCLWTLPDADTVAPVTVVSKWRQRLVRFTKNHNLFVWIWMKINFI
jgi:hypothetical protein